MLKSRIFRNGQIVPKGLLVGYAWDMKMEFTCVKFAYVNFTYVITNVKYITKFVWKHHFDMSKHWTVQIAYVKFFIYLKIYKYLRQKTKRFGV